MNYYQTYCYSDETTYRIKASSEEEAMDKAYELYYNIYPSQPGLDAEHDALGQISVSLAEPDLFADGYVISFHTRVGIVHKAEPGFNPMLSPVSTMGHSLSRPPTR